MKLFTSRVSAGHSYAHLAFFSGWTAADLDRLDRLAEVVEYEPGEIITSQGLPTGREFLVLTCGRATVKSHRSSMGLVAGDCIGAEEMLVGGSRLGTAVIADTYVKAILLGPREFHGLLAEAPSLGRRLSLLLATRLASA